MSDILRRIQQLAASGEVRISAHGFDELSSDDISLAELLDSLPRAQSVEEYPEYHKGPCVLVLQRIADQSPLHALWGWSRNSPDVAALITAYRP